ncbi:MAG: sialidase family protein [bacterium]
MIIKKTPIINLLTRIIILLLLLSLFTMQLLSQEFIRSQPGYIKSEFIFPLNHKPTAQCHAPTIALSGDRLIVAWFGGTKEKHPDVGIWLSYFDGTVWSKPVEVANGMQANSQRYPTWNPVLCQPVDGPLLLFYKAGPSPMEWWGMLTTSFDNGTTWSKSFRLPDKILGPIKNKPLQRDDGMLLCFSSTEHEGWRVHVEWTTDLGKTWGRSESLRDDSLLGAIQPTVLIHPKGTLQLLCRTRTGFIAESWSNDNGRTWGVLQSTSLPNPNSGIDAVTLSNGNHLLVYNHVQKDAAKWGGPRTPLNVALSEDGRKWNPVLLLENEPGEYSYPAVIQTSDNLVHIVYTYRRESIKHVVLDPMNVHLK